jgi:hypothetical protein
LALLPALALPGRLRLTPGAVYRLRLAGIPRRPGLTVYPTLEVPPVDRQAVAFLAHAYVPVSFTDEDLDRAAAGDFVVRVLYLPQGERVRDPDGPAVAPVSRKEAADPIAEARRRGHVVAVLRLGGIDLEAGEQPGP